MKSVLAATVSAATIGLATAQDQSRPFFLVLESLDEAKYNNQYLSTCHSGAGLASLCFIKDTTHKPESYNTFHFNTTSGTSSPFGPIGTLTWNEPFNSPNTEYISQPLSIYTPYSTNVGQAFFGASAGQLDVAIGFGKKGTDTANLMTIFEPYNDLVQPPTDEDERVLMRWYVCPTNYEAYGYETLNWLFGEGQPQNAECSSVKVKRVWA